jgi:hypothetical protein
MKQDATLHSLFYLETALHVSGGTSTHHQERKQLYLRHLVFVTRLLLPAAIAAGRSNRVTNTTCCRYSFCAPDDGWCYHPKHVEKFPDKINCVTLHLVGYILEYKFITYFSLYSRVIKGTSETDKKGTYGCFDFECL